MFVKVRGYSLMSLVVKCSEIFYRFSWKPEQMLLLLFTRGDRVTFFSHSSSPPLWEPTNHTEEWISVPLWPPPIRSLPNRSSPEPWLRLSIYLTLECLNLGEPLTLQLVCYLVLIDLQSPIMLSLLCPQGNAANEASCSALSLKKQIWSPNSASHQKCNLGKLLSLLELDFLLLS